MQLAIVLLVLFVSTETTDDACFSNESCTTTEIAITDVTESDDLNITTTEMPPIKEVILQQSFSTGCFCDLQVNFFLFLKKRVWLLILVLEQFL